MTGLLACGTGSSVQGRPCRPDCCTAVGAAMSRSPRQRRAQRGRSPTLTSSGAGGYPWKQELAVVCSTYMTDDRASSCSSRRVRKAAERRTHAARESSPGSCGPGACRCSWDLRAPGTAVCPAGAALGCSGGGTRAHRGIHREAARFVDRAATRAFKRAGGDPQRRDEQSLAGRPRRRKAPGVRWPFALRSSSWLIASRQSGWRRPTRSSCPRAGA